MSRAISIILFVATLLGSGALLSEFRPFTGVPGVEGKFAWLAEHRDDYDTLFIGTSRIYRGIQPAIFDGLTAAAGVPTHSFNFGIDAMSPPEDAFVFDRIAALHPKHLRWVFIESGMIRSGVGYGGEENVRSVYWHDGARTMLALHALASAAQRPRGPGAPFDRPESPRPVKLALSHSRLWLVRTLNAGRGAQIIQSWLAPGPRVHASSVIGRTRDGYIPPGDGRPMMPEDHADYVRRFAEHTAHPARISFLDGDAQRSLEDMLTRLRALGARPVLIIPPYLTGGRPFPQPGGDAPVLDYGVIEKWPALFDIANRSDRSHLNPTGADLFTRAVAADYIDLARRSGNSR